MEWDGDIILLDLKALHAGFVKHSNANFVWERSHRRASVVLELISAS